MFAWLACGTSIKTLFTLYVARRLLQNARFQGIWFVPRPALTCWFSIFSVILLQHSLGSMLSQYNCSMPIYYSHNTTHLQSTLHSNWCEKTILLLNLFKSRQDILNWVAAGYGLFWFVVLPLSILASDPIAVLLLKWLTIVWSNQ